MLFDLNIILNKSLIMNYRKLRDTDIIFINSFLTGEFIRELQRLFSRFIFAELINIPALIYEINNLIQTIPNENPPDAEQTITLIKYIIYALIDTGALNIGDDEDDDEDVDIIINSCILLLRTTLTKDIEKNKNCCVIC